MTFKEKLVILRKTRGITQDEFASAVGVSRQAVYKWECGQSYPEVPKLLEIKLLFGISIDNLLDDTFEIALPEKKKRKRLSKEAIRRIEESFENESFTNTERVETIARAAFQPVEEINEKAEIPAIEEPVVEEATEEAAPVEEEESVVFANVKSEEPAEEAVAETAVEETAEELVTEEALPVEEDVAEEETGAPEKKKGFFGRLFGKK